MSQCNSQTTPSYALFKDGEQISKSHSTRDVCVIEAYERGLVVVGFKDFVSDPGPYRQLPVLANNVEIKEVMP